jgi:hypothetical protein
MPKVICAWLNCKHNSFGLSEKMKDEIRKGLVISGSGKCLYNGTIKLLLEETEEELLICDNYEDDAKFDV